MRNSSFINKFILSILLLLPISAFAQDELPKNDRKAVVKAVTSTYRTWNSVRLDGKIQTSLIPVSPSVRIYMEKDRLIDASVRAPFLGEVARVVVSNDTALVINKMTRVYAKLAVADLLRDIPVGIGELQDLLLGRVFVAGAGEFSVRNADDVAMFPAAEGGTLLLPPPVEVPVEVKYGFRVADDGKLMLFMALPEGIDIQAIAEYSYEYNQTSVAASYQYGQKKFDATLSYSAPAFNADPIAPVNIDSGYRQGSLRDVLRF